MTSWRSVVSLDTVVSYEYPGSPRLHRFLLRLRSSPDTPDLCDNNPIVAGFTPTYTIEYYHLHSLLVRLSLRFIRTKNPSWAGLSVTYWRPVVSFDTLVYYGYTGSPQILRFFRYSRYPGIFLIISFLQIPRYFPDYQYSSDTLVFSGYSSFILILRYTTFSPGIPFLSNSPFSPDTPVFWGYSVFFRYSGILRILRFLQILRYSSDPPVFLRYSSLI